MQQLWQSTTTAPAQRCLWAGLLSLQARPLLDVLRSGMGILGVRWARALAFSPTSASAVSQYMTTEEALHCTQAGTTRARAVSLRLTSLDGMVQRGPLLVRAWALQVLVFCVYSTMVRGKRCMWEAILSPPAAMWLITSQNGMGRLGRRWAMD